MTWGQKRQASIILFFILILIIIGCIIIYPYVFKDATCTDGNQNGGEVGVDCGGKCSVLCPFQTSDITVKWAKTFQVTDTVWSVAAYVTNENVNAGASELEYEFKIYDTDRKFIYSKTGKTFISPNQSTIIYEGGINVGTRKPVYASFSVLKKPVWYVVDPRIMDITLSPTEQKLINEDTRPRFTALIENTSDVQTVSDVDVLVVFFDEQENAVAVSRTYIDEMNPMDTKQVYFTWQEPFTRQIIRKELYIRFNPFTTKIK